MSRVTRRAAVLPAALALAPAAFAQTTRYVAPCGDDTWTGLSSTCAAPNGPTLTVQAAINASASGDTVQIAPGSYVGLIDFAGRNITVQGAGIGQTVLDGLVAQQLRGPVVTFSHGEGPAAVLRDLSIQHASPFSGNAGGVYISGSGPTIINCDLHDNLGSGTINSAGGVMALNSSATLIDCRFNHNDGDPAGGVYAVGGSMWIVNCFFGNNGALYAAVVVRGGAVVNLVNCTLAGNGGFDGGLRVEQTGSIANVANCIFWQNLGTSGTQIYTMLGVANVSYSDVQHGYAGTGNFDADPLLINSFQISSASPCIDRGDNSVFATYGDILGQPRAVTVNPPATPAPYPGPRIDVGCFEVQPCYANCDQSTTPPILNVNDFICFQTRFAAGCP